MVDAVILHNSDMACRRVLWQDAAELDFGDATVTDAEVRTSAIMKPVVPSLIRVTITLTSTATSLTLKLNRHAGVADFASAGANLKSVTIDDTKEYALEILTTELLPYFQMQITDGGGGSVKASADCLMLRPFDNALETKKGYFEARRAFGGFKVEDFTYSVAVVDPE